MSDKEPNPNTIRFYENYFKERESAKGPCFKHAMKFPKENECPWCQIESLLERVAELTKERDWHESGFESANAALGHMTDKRNALDVRIDELKAKVAELDGQACEHDWFKHEAGDNMEQCRHCDLWRDEPTDDYMNPLDGDRLIYCSFPDCGCDGARNCMAENGASGAAIEINLEKGAPARWWE